MAKKKKEPHCVMGNDSVRCLNCGKDYRFDIRNGVSINMFAAVVKAFDKDHKGCKPSERGKQRFEFNTPEEWAESWDTGISSATIWSVMTGKPTFMHRFGTPGDPSDFGRCYRLLQKFPAWRQRLDQMSTAHPEWAPYVLRWDEMEKLYEEELPSGTAPKLYAVLKELGK